MKLVGKENKLAKAITSRVGAITNVQLSFKLNISEGDLVYSVLESPSYYKAYRYIVVDSYPLNSKYVIVSNGQSPPKKIEFGKPETHGIKLGDKTIITTHKKIVVPSLGRLIYYITNLNEGMNTLLFAGHLYNLAQLRPEYSRENIYFIVFDLFMLFGWKLRYSFEEKKYIPLENKQTYFDKLREEFHLSGYLVGVWSNYYMYGLTLDEIKKRLNQYKLEGGESENELII